jgi:hypothetical protein
MTGADTRSLGSGACTASSSASRTGAVLLEPSYASPMGRRVHERREAMLKLKLRPTELRSLREQAAAAGLTVSEIVRRRVFGGAPCEGSAASCERLTSRAASAAECVADGEPQDGRSGVGEPDDESVRGGRAALHSRSDQPSRRS